MNDAETQFRAAVVEARQARRALKEQAQYTGNRLRPQQLLRNATQSSRELASDVADLSKDTVRNHPLPAVAVGAGLLAFIFRKPLTQAAPHVMDAVNDGLQALSRFIGGNNNNIDRS